MPTLAAATTFEEFQATARAAGADEVLVRQWGPDAVVPEHTHGFSVEAVVTEGEMWLTCGGSTQHLKVGDTFSMQRDTPHAERYGPEGATYWVARRNAA
jgi:quercetin dioxygenase-like cupin family protein